jgi:two-component system sensor histidine kinase TctE
MEALDQALADASLALVPHLEVVDGEPRFVFPAAAEQVLRTDRVDDIYYSSSAPPALRRRRHRPAPRAPDEQELRGDRVSFDAHFRGHRVRVIAIHRRSPARPSSSSPPRPPASATSWPSTWPSP